MKALVGAFNQEKALVGAFSVIVKTDFGTDGSFYSTTQGGRVLRHPREVREGHQDLRDGGGGQPREPAAEIRGQGPVFPRESVPPLHRRPERSTRRAEIRAAVPRIRRQQGGEADKGTKC